MDDHVRSQLDFERSPAYLQWRLDRIARRHGARIRDLAGFRDQVLEWFDRAQEPSQDSPWRSGIRDDFETVLSRRLEADSARYDLAVKRLFRLTKHYSLDFQNPSPRFLPGSLPAYAATEVPRDWEAEKIAHYDQYVREHNAAVHQASPLTYDPTAATWLTHIWNALPDRQPSRLAVDRLWLYQARDFGNSAPGGQARIRGAAELLRPLAPEDVGASGETLERSLALATERGCGETARQIVELEIPYGMMLFGSETSRVNGDFGELTNFVGKIEATLRGTVRLVHANSGGMRLRIPSASLLEALLEAVLPERCPQFQFVDGAISQDLANDLHAQWKIPVGLARQPIYLKDFCTEVHPFFYTFHDYFHGYMATYLPRSVVAASVELYRLASRHLPDSPFTRYHLNALVDLDPGMSEDRSMLRFFKKSLNPVNKVMGDLEISESVNRRQVAKDLKAGIRFLENYLEILRENSASSSETAAHFQAIEADLQRRLWAFQRELEAHQNAGGLEPLSD